MTPTETKVRPEDLIETTQMVETKVVKIGDKTYFADRVNKDNFITHVDCKDCGKEFKKDYTYQKVCRGCEGRNRAQKYASLELVEWDGKTVLCLFGGDKYFFDIDDIISYAEDHEVNPRSLKLVICKESSFPEIDYSYFTEDCTHENWEPSKRLDDALKAFNEVLRTESTRTWFPTNKRVTIDFSEYE